MWLLNIFTEGISVGIALWPNKTRSHQQTWNSRGWSREVFGDSCPIRCWSWCCCVCQVGSIDCQRTISMNWMASQFSRANCHFLTISRANPEFRKTLINTVPGSEPLLKIFLQEEGNVVSEASKSISNATHKVIGVKDSIVGYFGDDKPSSKPAEKAPPTTATPSKSTEYLFFDLSNWMTLFIVCVKIGASSSPVAAPPMPSLTAPKPTTSPPSAPKPSKSAAPVAEPKPSEPLKLPPILTQPLPQTWV